ncbi:hypothetical protein [Paenibacillus ferrarius]|nr:hypothetical protein [Paenibacillus ferrarius]
MLNKSNYMSLVVLNFILALSACADKDRAPLIHPAASPAAEQARWNKEDIAIRAVGTLPEGKLIVKPMSQAVAAPLGAPSCYGQETDLRWSGHYEAWWESTSEGGSSKVSEFPDDFEIVQQSEAPTPMQHFQLGGIDILAYVPRYTDCHGLETYFFGVKEGKAFPLKLMLNDGQIVPQISQIPHRSLQIQSEELVLTGGFGAGQEFVDVYHFQYDARQQLLIVASKEKVKYNDLIFDE